MIRIGYALALVMALAGATVPPARSEAVAVITATGSTVGGPSPPPHPNV